MLLLLQRGNGIKVPTDGKHAQPTAIDKKNGNQLWGDTLLMMVWYGNRRSGFKLC